MDVFYAVVYPFTMYYKQQKTNYQNCNSEAKLHYNLIPIMFPDYQIFPLSFPSLYAFVPSQIYLTSISVLHPFIQV